MNKQNANLTDLLNWRHKRDELLFRKRNRKRNFYVQTFTVDNKTEQRHQQHQTKFENSCLHECLKFSCFFFTRFL